MALFKKGKGPREQSWEIQRQGTLVRGRRVDGPTQMLPGFMQCESELAAQAQVESLISEWAGKGYKPADDEARTLAGLPGAQPAKPAQSSWPTRADYAVANDSNGMMVTSMAMAGKPLEEGSKKWLKAVNDARMIPLSLHQDNSFNVRVVGGQELSDQEREEWVACLEWPLSIPDGKLAISGGAILVDEEYTPEDADPFLCTVAVPKGRYRVSLYTQYPGVNGQAALDHLAGGYGKSTPAGTWWRQTRLPEALPTWLRQWCVAHADTDPGHESEWEGVEYLKQDETPDIIDFLIHLEPDAEAQAPRKFTEEDGWFPTYEGARRPEACPRGLEGKEVQKSLGSSSGKWIYVHELDQAVERFRPLPLSDGPLSIAPEQLSLLYCLARFCQALAVPQFRAQGDLRNDVAFSGKDGCVLVSDPNHVRILFSNDQRPQQHQQSLRELAAWLKGLPVGTRWELSCAHADPRGREGDHPPALHRYRGQITEAGWSLNESYPAVSRSELEQALELAREVDGGEAFTLRDESELQAIRNFVRNNHGPWMEEDNRPVFEDGRFSLTPPDPGLLGIFGGGAFAVRHRDSWPVNDLSDDD